MLRKPTLALAIIVWTALRLQAATYYVATTGSDSNPGSQAQPWRTIAKSASVMAAGDTVMVAAGSYGESVSTVRNGTANARITFLASSGAVTKTFNVGHSYITINGFEMTGANQSNMMTVTENNFELLNNTIHDTGGSAGVIRLDDASNNALIQGNHFYGTGSPGDDFPQVIVQGNNHVVQNNEIGPVKDADAFRAWGNNNVIRGNYLHDITLSPGSAAHTDILQTFGSGIGGIVFENNLIDQTNAGTSSNSNNLQMLMTENNGNPTTGSWEIRNNIYINVPGQANVGIPNVHFYNNTTYTCGKNNNLIMFMYNIAGKGDYTGAQIKNNIFVTPNGLTNYSGVISYDSVSAPLFPGVTVDYNQATKVGSFGTLNGFNEAHGVSGGDPKFVNAATSDFHLTTGSPNIDKALTIAGFSNDHDGVTRPQGAAWDIGAFEFTGGATTFSPCDIDKNNLTNAVDLQLMVNQTLSVIPCTSDINKDSMCTAADVQRVVNAVLGGVCLTTP